MTALKGMDRKKEALSEAEKALEAAQELTRGQTSPVPGLGTCLYIDCDIYLYLHMVCYMFCIVLCYLQNAAEVLSNLYMGTLHRKTTVKFLPVQKT